jgi:hypothetical protein
MRVVSSLLFRGDVNRLPILLLPIVIACGGEDRGGDDATTPTARMREPLASAHLVPDRASSDGLAAANLTVEAALAASLRAGGTRLVTTGTIDSNGWKAEPSDRLVVIYEGRTFTVRVSAMNGVFTSTDDFFSSNHLLEAMIASDGIEIAVRSERNGGVRRAAARGRMAIDEVWYTFDLTSNGSEYFEHDTTGVDYQEEHRLQGSVDFEGAHLDVDESWRFHLVSSSGPGGAAVSNAIRTIGNRLQAGGHTYEWSGVRTQKAFRDGRPSEVDSYWGAAGSVLRDGQPYGQYRFQADLVTREAGYLKFLLELPSETVEVESWTVY